MIYQIKIEGPFDPGWSDWLGDVKLQTMQGNDGKIISLLTVAVSDQSALFGILDSLRDLNRTLVSVNPQAPAGHAPPP